MRECKDWTVPARLSPRFNREVEASSLRTLDALKTVAVGAAITLAVLVPPFSYLMGPHAPIVYRRELISRVEFDHDYFGAI